MALARDTKSQPSRLEPAASDKRGQSVARLRLNLQESDIRELGPRESESRESEYDDLEATKAFELIGDRPWHEGICPPPLALDAAIAQYAKLAHGSAVVLHSLRIGDLPIAAATLMQENSRLQQELDSIRADFDELRSVNLAIQDQADEAMGVADDQRLALLGELEQAHTELLEREGQLEQSRRDYENDLGEIRQQRDALELENFELKARLAEGKIGV
jgi:hypothetical protein